MPAIATEVSFAETSLRSYYGIDAENLFIESQKKVALYQNCKKTIRLAVPILDSSGFDDEKIISVNLIMPIEYQTIVKQDFLQKKLNYFIDVLGIGYLYGTLWLSFYGLILLPFWAFFLLFISYRFGVNKISAGEV